MSPVPYCNAARTSCFCKRVPYIEYLAGRRVGSTCRRGAKRLVISRFGHVGGSMVTIPTILYGGRNPFS